MNNVCVITLNGDFLIVAEREDTYFMYVTRDGKYLGEIKHGEFVVDPKHPNPPTDSEKRSYENRFLRLLDFLVFWD